MLSKETLENIKQQRIDVDGNIGSEMATELLALREQLEALKQQDPIGQVIFGGYNSGGTRDVSVVCLHDQADWDNFQDGTLLFMEPRPAGD
ncbi:hypothetical protein [Yersinia massiliensis]|uniref:Uncharacterized protein n=1 Tax=Yersinia massiliensis TaxID=419257 RepID=A0ABM6US93_9GAMM|nr:hypothetical protein [Yersinia massiliensis]AVX37782.1 hypothetical protein DA391_08985 [Yersinia massiliensis]